MIVRFLISIFVFSFVFQSAFSQALTSKTFKKAEKAYYKNEFAKAKELYVNTIETYSDCAPCHAQLANIFANESDFESGLEEINKAIDLEEKNKNEEGNLGYYYSIRSFLYFNLDDFDSSQEDISTAIKNDNKNNNYYFMRSLMRRMKGDIVGCCQDLEMAKELGNKKAEDYITIYCVK